MNTQTRKFEVGDQVDVTPIVGPLPKDHYGTGGQSFVIVEDQDGDQFDLFEQQVEKID